MSYVLGVDGGNTKTIALVARLDGTIAGVGRGRCGDIYSKYYGVDGAIAEIARAVREALAAAQAEPEDVLIGAFSMAGADWPEDFALLEREMCRLGFGQRIIVVNDALGALRAGTTNGAGVSVVCGTGCAIGARAADGRIWHTSFWQEPGGADQLGQKTLRAVYRAELRIDPPTTLSARVLEFFGLSDVESVLHHLTARGDGPQEDISQLARVLLGEADGGDATARRIVQEHGAALGDYTLAAARRVGIERTPFTLVLAGGVLRHPTPLLREALIARIRSVAPDVQPSISRFEPAVGALLLALEAAHIAIDEPLRAHLAATLPPAAFFVT
ncbi:MAG TPA: BadF/BadG/BcrA/BcrD ATPase family protein [Roseiflexaceae bacterium]|nr:BadF/BadG/BcrA/BcrD ATPase family protein [Roseiflexaceae bacterium]